MAKTKAQLREGVLRYLGRISEGRSPNAYQTQVTDIAIDTAQSMLETDGLAYWETSAIPDDVFQPMKVYVASFLAPELLAAQEASPYVLARDRALNEIRSMVSTAVAPAPQAHRYF